MTFTSARSCSPRAKSLGNEQLAEQEPEPPDVEIPGAPIVRTRRKQGRASGAEPRRPNASRISVVTESLTLEDFAADFSKVQIPDKDGPLSDGEMKVVVDTFLNTLERA